MKDFFEILIAEKGNSLSEGSFTYLSQVKELLKMYFDGAGILCVYNYSIECCAQGLLELGYPYDIIVISRNQQDLLRAAKALEKNPWIIVTKPRNYEVNCENDNLSFWEGNVLHLVEWTDFNEFVKIFDSKLGGIYCAQKKKSNPEINISECA